MRKGYLGFVVLSILAGAAVPAAAQVSVGIALPHVNIGINLPVYPELVPVPGYPVYYAPGVNSNYFFYDGRYWVYQGDNWYSSAWYNGPWGPVAPEFVPVFILRVPVSYYRRPPAYFHGWRGDAAPRWGDHYGHDWERRRAGWDHWDRNRAPAAAPLPVYQRRYSGDRYPREEQQRELHTQNYRYQPRDPVVRERFAREQPRGDDRQRSAVKQGGPGARERAIEPQNQQRARNEGRDRLPAPAEARREQRPAEQRSAEQRRGKEKDQQRTDEHKGSGPG